MSEPTRAAPIGRRPQIPRPGEWYSPSTERCKAIVAPRELRCGVFRRVPGRRQPNGEAVTWAVTERICALDMRRGGLWGGFRPSKRELYPICARRAQGRAPGRPMPGKASGNGRRQAARGSPGSTMRAHPLRAARRHRAQLSAPSWTARASPSFAFIRMSPRVKWRSNPKLLSSRALIRSSAPAPGVAALPRRAAPGRRRERPAVRARQGDAHHPLVLAGLRACVAKCAPLGPRTPVLRPTAGQRCFRQSRSASKPWNAIGRNALAAGQRQDTSPYSVRRMLPPPSAASDRRIGFGGSWPGSALSSRHISRTSTSGRIRRPSQSRLVSGPESSARSATKSAQRDASPGSASNSPSSPSDSALCSERDAASPRTTPAARAPRPR